MALANIAVKVVLAILMLMLMKNCRKPELVIFENHSVRTKHLCQSEVWLVRLVMNDHELQLYNEVHGDRSMI